MMDPVAIATVLTVSAVDVLTNEVVPESLAPKTLVISDANKLELVIEECFVRAEAMALMRTSWKAGLPAEFEGVLERAGMAFVCDL